jgi:hypothetical protein
MDNYQYTVRTPFGQYIAFADPKGIVRDFSTQHLAN